MTKKELQELYIRVIGPSTDMAMEVYHDELYDGFLNPLLVASCVEAYNRGRRYQHQQDVEWLDKHSHWPLSSVCDWDAFVNLEIK